MPLDSLREEYQAWQGLFQAQPLIIQRFLEAQAGQLADALVQRAPQARFTLPDQVVPEVSERGEGRPVRVPPEQREQSVGGFVDRLTGGDIRIAVRQRLAELEQSRDRQAATAAGVLRHATGMYMVHEMLPAGRSVTYAAPEEGGIPCLPVGDALEPESALTAPSDAIVEEGRVEAGRGTLTVPFVPSARKFYLPQWVAFDEEDRLLVGSIGEAEAHVRSMQRFLGILHAAVSLAPYMVADEEYQRKRYGMLGQLVNQGRALARYLTGEIIRTIQRRAAANDLNRGLSLSLPYFDDQSLEMKTRDFEVIPAGRIMFIPAFVVRAAREEQAKAAQDTRLDPATRTHLLHELSLLAKAFESSSLDRTGPRQ
ncbi:MAG: hypothetical protein AB1449_08515 [Chloroflexota bacterium]